MMFDSYDEAYEAGRKAGLKAAKAVCRERAESHRASIKHRESRGQYVYTGDLEQSAREAEKCASAITIDDMHSP